MPLSPALTLKILGTTADEIRALASPYRVDTALSEPDYLTGHRIGDYLDLPQQQRAHRRLTRHADWIVKQFRRGYRPRQIAYFLACSEESVRRRLRNAGLLRSQA